MQYLSFCVHELGPRMGGAETAALASFLADLLALYRAGRISEEEARRACPHPAEFDRALQGISSR